MKLIAKRVFLKEHTAQALLPSQVARAYNFPAGVDVSKRTVAIVELGGAYNQLDVATYCQKHGYKQPRLFNVLVDGATQIADPQGADGEVCLDIDIVAAVAQGVRIVVVFAPNSEQGFIDGVNKAIDLNPDAVSISWGAPETDWSEAGRAALDAAFLRGAQLGIPCFCASGDGGSKDGTSSDVTDYPACSPYAIACGGTRLEIKGDGSRASESAWSTPWLFGASGSGGGVSKAYSQTPHWQAIADTQPGRHSPDLSGNADPVTGYIIDIDGQERQVGGTSAVAPLYAALQAIMNAGAGRHIGNLHTKMYQSAELFYDITGGTNGGYSAGPGYDCVTGLGVIDGGAFVLKYGAPLPHVTDDDGSIAGNLQAAIDAGCLVQFLNARGVDTRGLNGQQLLQALKVACEVGQPALDKMCPIIEKS